MWGLILLLAFVALWHSLPVDGTICTNGISGNGFTNISDIYNFEETDLTLLPDLMDQTAVGDDSINFRRWLFPDIVINCTGNITGWIFRGEVVSDLDVMNLPLLQVFYESPAISESMRRFTIRPGSEAVPAVSIRNVKGVYEYTLQSPIEVQVGDVVVIQYQQFPSTNTQFLRMAFKSDNSSITGSIRDMRGGSFLQTGVFSQIEDFIYEPLITALMSFLEVTSTMVMPASSNSASPSDLPNIYPSATASVLMSSSQFPIPSVTTGTLIISQPNGRSLGLVLAVGVVVGLVVALVVVATVIVAMLLACRVKKNRQVSIMSAGEFSTPLNSPTCREASRDIVIQPNDAYSCVKQLGAENTRTEVDDRLSRTNDDLPSLDILTKSNEAYSTVPEYRMENTSSFNSNSNCVHTEANVAYESTTMESRIHEEYYTEIDRNTSLEERSSLGILTKNNEAYSTIPSSNSKSDCVHTEANVAYVSTTVENGCDECNATNSGLSEGNVDADQTIDYFYADVDHHTSHFNSTNANDI